MSRTILKDSMTTTDDRILKISVRRFGDILHLMILTQPAKDSRFPGMKTDKSSVKQGWSLCIRRPQRNQVRHCLSAYEHQ